MSKFPVVKALTFDLFGTVLDLEGSLSPYIAAFLQRESPGVTVEKFWSDWRIRQRLEQYQDTMLMLGHSGYLETVRRSCHYVLRLNGIDATPARVGELMAAWQFLSPFPEVIAGLERMRPRFRLVILSNGDPHYLDHLEKNRVGCSFDASISATGNGAFKPHPGVYRRAAQLLGLEVGECLMVSSNSFDVLGARACGYRAAYVDRYRLPMEDTPYQPDLTVANFTELASALV